MLIYPLTFKLKKPHVCVFWPLVQQIIHTYFLFLVRVSVFISVLMCWELPDREWQENMHWNGRNVREQLNWAETWCSDSPHPTRALDFHGPTLITPPVLRHFQMQNLVPPGNDFVSFPSSPLNFESGRIWFFDLPSNCQLWTTRFYFVFCLLIWVKTWTEQQPIETGIGTRKTFYSLRPWENSHTICSLCDETVSFSWGFLWKNDCYLKEDAKWSFK